MTFPEAVWHYTNSNRENPLRRRQAACVKRCFDEIGFDLVSGESRLEFLGQI